MVVVNYYSNFHAYNFNVIAIFSFLKGDMFIVHNELEDGWMWVTNLRTDEQGLIVEDLVEEVVSFVLFFSQNYEYFVKFWNLPIIMEISCEYISFMIKPQFIGIRNFSLKCICCY